MTNDGGELAALVDALGDEDEGGRRRAGEDLLRLGPLATGALAGALAHPAVRVRQSAAFLLRRAEDDGATDVAAALAAALADPDPKVRKNAAVSLGRAGAAAHLAELARALEAEQIGWVRPSLVLAAGAAGGPEAHALLLAVAPQGDEERDALRKALDHTSPERPRAAWVAGGWRPASLLDTPVGFERAAADEAEDAGLPRPAYEGHGRLRLEPGVRPDDLTALLRCSYAPLMVAAEGPPLPLDDPAGCAERAAEMVAGSEALRRWREWVAVEGGGELRYRLAIGRRVRAPVQRALLDSVRRAAAPLGMADSPSRYVVELRVESGPRGAQLLVRPWFAPDGRFDYRLQDVPAAIDPVVAAGLARMVRTGESAEVFDPTCGSGTLLVERGRLGSGRLHGLDISAAAVAAARGNLAAAGLTSRASVLQGDAFRPRAWPPCDEVVANLPFGMRTQLTERDIAGLHAAVVANLAVALREGGRAVLYTALPEEIEHAVRQSRRLSVVHRVAGLVGGVQVEALIVE